MAYNLYRSLAEKHVVIPYLQNAFRDISNWPGVMNIDDPRRHDSKTDSYFHPSIHADMCALGCYITLEPEERAKLLPERTSFTSVLTPLMGSVTHTIVQQKLIADKLVSSADVEIALIDEEHHWKGHADLLFKDELVDIKTMRAFKFGQTKNALPYWEKQLACYMDAMNKKTSVVLVIETGWPYAMKEFRVNQNNEVLDDIYEKFAFVQQCIKDKTPPSHEGCDNRYCVVLERYDGEIPR